VIILATNVANVAVAVVVNLLQWPYMQGGGWDENRENDKNDKNDKNENRPIFSHFSSGGRPSPRPSPERALTLAGRGRFLPVTSQ
jgi:hypothetical protein